MITVKAEKEIDEKNKIFMGITLRQMVVIVIFLIIGALIRLIIKPPQAVFMFICTIFGVLTYYLAFKEYEGFPPEYSFMKKIRTMIFNNEKRYSRTKNRYLGLLNNAYGMDRLEELKDRKIKRAIRKEKRADKKLLRKDRLKYYY